MATTQRLNTGVGKTGYVVLVESSGRILFWRATSGETSRARRSRAREVSVRSLCTSLATTASRVCIWSTNSANRMRSPCTNPQRPRRLAVTRLAPATATTRATRNPRRIRPNRRIRSAAMKSTVAAAARMRTGMLL
jgi:hypothetical protein